MEGNSLAFNERVQGFIAEYEAVLLGRKSHLSYWYCSGIPLYDEKMALEVIRYAFEELLKWTPEMIYECKDIALLDRMRLHQIYKTKIIHAKDRYCTCFQLIAAKLYPSKFKIDTVTSVIEIYKRVLDGELERLPRNIFNTEDGIMKLGYCVRYILTEKIMYSSVRELYDRFSSIGINTELDSFKLLKIYPLFFETPVDMLHYCLPKSLRDDEYYQKSKKKYISIKLSMGAKRIYIREYRAFLYCKTDIEPMRDDAGNYKVEHIRSVFYYVINTLLPKDPIIVQDEYDFNDRNTLYMIFTRDDIDFILDKYRILEMVRAVSDNYVDAADMLLSGDERDEDCYRYASRIFETNHRTDYVPLPMIVRQYIAVLNKQGKASDVIKNKEDLNTCLYYLTRHILPYNEKYKGRPLSDLLNDSSFVENYCLNDVIHYIR